MKNKLNLLTVALIFIFIVLGCSNIDKNTSQQPAQPNEPRVNLSATELIKAYDENEIAADAKYKGKPLSVKGKISDIAETFGQLSAQMQGSDPANFMTVMCSFNESQKQSVGTLKKGQTVTFEGTGDGKTSGLYVGLTACRVL